MKDVAQQLEIIKRGTVAIYSESELKERLTKSKPLVVKLGVDPTAPDIHLGHTVTLRKLRQFQDLGHQAVLIIGDFTTLIGDPSGRDKTRPQLATEDIERNAKTYFDHVGKVLNLNTLKIVRNSTWLSKLTFLDIIKLAAQVTVARSIERDDFAQRLANKTPIGLHELLYPLMQGYDSVAINADVELGGNDQTFNLLVGRDLQKSAGQPQQIAVTLPMLVGLDGTDKMSKSLGNYIGVTDAPDDMFGKVMSIPDKLMKDWFILLTEVPAVEVETLCSGKTHPRDAKVRLAKEIVTFYHTAADAESAAQRFDAVFSRKEIPDDIKEVPVPEPKIWPPKLIVLCGAAKSNNEAKRLIEQGGVTIDGVKLTDPDSHIEVKDGQVLKVGKKNRFYRLRVNYNHK
ncbi:MAG: tyrosine--tRNA ligase [Planctomycetes bacterium]|nr:tyrosine--tRNA ligase [Planctomycetota bacterium]